MADYGFNKQSVIKGALILTVAGLFIRVLGAVYRVPLGRILGDEGLGLYGVPNQFYLLFFTLASAGIPVAVSRLVAEKNSLGHYRDAYRVFRLARFAMLLVGLTASFALYLGAGWLVESGIVADPRCYKGLKAIAPVVFFAAVTAAYRGLFQGVRNMTAVAVSQVADQIMLVIATLLLAYLLLPYGLDQAAAGGNMGAIPGAIAALGVMLFYHWYYRRKFLYYAAKDNIGRSEGSLTLLKKIFAMAIPISFASIAMAVTGIIDNKLIIDRLQLVGYTMNQATAFYGQFNQMAMSFINISIAFAASLGVSLVPSVTEFFSARKFTQIRKQVSESVRLVIVLSLPAATGLFILASQLTTMVFANETAGISLAWLSWVVIFWSIHLVTSGALQGMGRVDIPVRNLLFGIVFKVTITYYFLPTPLEIRAAALGTVAMFMVSSILNICSIKSRVGFEFNFARTVLRPGLATLIMAAGVIIIYHLLVSQIGNNWATLVAVMTGALIYAPAILMVGGLSIKELSIIPGIGKRLTVLTEKFKKK